MSGTFSIAAVTAVLKDLLNDGLADHDLSAVGNVAVTALPPDRIPVTNADEKSQINLFLFQVTPNASLRNNLLPSHSATGERITNPPLAIDLRYLVTAYGEKEFHSEALLGYAMQLLHDNPVLTRSMINATLKPTLPPDVTLPPGLAMIATADLAEQAESIKISPVFMNPEEMSRLWSALQAKYRPTAVYQVSVILMQSNGPARAPLPVLKRGEQDRGPIAQGDMTPRYPMISGLVLPNHQTLALLGDVVTLQGSFLAGETGLPANVTAIAQLTGLQGSFVLQVPIPVADRTDRQIQFTVPNTPAALFAGVYTLSLSITPTGKPEEARRTAEIPFLIGPAFATPLAPVARTGVDPQTGLGTAHVTLTTTPEVTPLQRASMVLNSTEVLSDPHPAQTNTLQFTIPNVAAGTHWVRLRVDGAESLLIDRSDPLDLKFDSTQRLTVT